MREAIPAACAERGSGVEQAMQNRVPLWLASAITVCVSLPFGSWLGDFNVPLWAAFIVWAEYFVLGAQPAVLRTIIPAYVIGSGGAVAILTLYAILSDAFGTARLYADHDIASFVAFFIGFCVLLYAQRWMPVTRTGMLPFFNGISMTLGVYFAESFFRPFGAQVSDINPIVLPAIAGIGAILAGLLGSFLGWLNVVILFQRPAR